jgi:hypothetical protein
MNHIAMRVAEYLKFNVACAFEIFLDVHVTVSKCRQRFAARKLKRARKIIDVARNAHALSTAARRRLDDDGESDFLRKLNRDIGIFNWSGRARHNGNTAISHRFARRRLIAHLPNLCGRGPDKRNAARNAGLGEFRVLG